MRTKPIRKEKPAYANQTEPAVPPFTTGHLVKYEGTKRWAEKVTYGSIGEVIAAMPGWRDGEEIHDGYNIIDFPQGRVGVTRREANLFNPLGPKVDKTTKEE